MKYRDIIRSAMEEMARDRRTVFLGYNILFGSRAYGTLNTVSKEQCIETPVAENLMAGLAIGLVLSGSRPVVFYERHDFVLNALDAIVNHLDKIETMSYGQFRTPVVIRAVVGGRAPLDPGLQHIQDYTEAFRRMVSFPVLDLTTPAEAREAYARVLSMDSPVMVVEHRDLYDAE